MSSQRRKYELKARAESQRETRDRIVQATVALHEEVGPAGTTVAEIARRAGVQRLTVYNHFPEEAELFAACQSRFLEAHPMPDLTPALALQDPGARARASLELLYRSYRDREPMTDKVQRDRGLIPALDRLLAATMDAQLGQLSTALGRGFGKRGTARRRAEATAALAVQFHTWKRLKERGFTDRAAAELMAELMACAARPRRSAVHEA